MAKKSETFGRDEMTALLGGHVAEETLSKAHNLVPSKSKPLSSSAVDDEPDVSTLTTAQTAALLKKKDLEKQQKLQSQQRGKTILRAQKKLHHVPNRHALLQEELEIRPQLPSNRIGDDKNNNHHQHDQKDDEWGSDQDEDRDFGGKKQERQKVEPQIVVRRERAEPQIVGRRRRSDSSSSSSSSSAGSDREPVSRHGKGSADDSSDDNEQDTRRQRLLAKRRQLALQTKVDLDQHHEMSSVDNEATPETSSKSIAPEMANRHEHEEEPSSNGDDSSSHGEGGSSDDSSSSSGADSSDEDVQVIAKPIFVPRHKRNTIVSQDQKIEEEKQRAAKSREEEMKRKMESRMMVAEVVAAASATPEEIDEEEGGGATNDIPDDSDPIDPIEMEKERDAWEVRELERLLNAQDLVDLREAEKAEYERRRAMTDEERLLEDEALGLYRRPGEQRKKVDVSAHQGKFMQRYYHRGAFYMDDNEWSKDDVRHKAKEYESAVTGNDKIDKSVLPKVMQVKNFGFARQNTKYKGLTHEDTTDKETHFLPLAQRKRQRR
ncbi:Microfibril-associated/Pre-mRNA processing [Fragilaria crotonensis]|nr:Microfibril-associated/Pre-mRNA processing [Fragilaria crotonensis]